MRFEHSGPPVTLQDIERVERLVGCPLPTSYREFMLKHNGGTPRPSGFTVVVDRLGASEDCVDGFHRISAPGADLEMLIELDRDPRQDHEQFEIASDAIWIGHAMSGELVLFVRGLRAGQVWLKLAREDHNNPMEGMTFLASTFDAFLNTLEPCEWDPERPG